MNNERMTPQKSISVIEDAMRKAQNETGGARFYLILWGALIAAYALINYFNLKFPASLNMVANWSWIVFPVGGLFSFLRTRKDDKTEVSKPLNDKLYMYTWGGTGLCLGAVSFFAINYGGLLIVPPVLLLLFGFTAFVTGGVTSFVPSIVGGILCIISAATAFVLPLEHQLVCTCVGVCTSTLVPGLLMKKQHA